MISKYWVVKDDQREKTFSDKLVSFNHGMLKSREKAFPLSLLPFLGAGDWRRRIIG